MNKNKKAIKQVEKKSEEKISSANTDLLQSSNDQLPPGRPDRTGLIHNSQPSTNDMEVHHHGHVHETKKWKEYIFQFLMLFLAVFSGFLAEYQLEQIIERHREKQFIGSLTTDIKADIVHLNQIIVNREKRQAQLDSLMILLNNSTLKESRNSIYFLAVQVSRRNPTLFTSNNGTMQQLKNSGGLRLIINRLIADSIAKYDVRSRNMETFGEIENAAFEDYRNSAAKIFNALEIEKMLDEDNNVSRPTNNPALLAFTKNDLNEINFKIHRMKFNNRGSKRDAQRLLHQAEIFLAALKKEYKLN